MVEPFSIDESWLDVTASQKLFGSGKEIADDIRKTVRSELGLTLSAGVSYNKLLAKMGSEYKKPDATTVVTEDNFRDLLWKQPASNLFGVGRATAEKLKKLRINFIGDIARTDKKQLMALLGKQGDLIWNYANGIDHSPVALYSQREPIKSVGNGITFKRNLTTYDDISTAVKSLSDTVASRLRQYGLKAYGVKVTIKDPNFNVISRQKQFSSPTWLSNEIATAAMDLMDCKGNFCSPIRMLTVTCINLTADPAQEQLSIFDEDLESRERSEKMEFTIDEVRKKYGSDAIVFASSIKNDLGI
jgi:DNA polymerase-4